MLLALLSIGLGAALGAMLRFGLGIGLNHLFPALPPGTLLANLLGGYLIGVAMGVFLHAPNLSPEWRLFVITGFLGGLTTFSTFSAEVVQALEGGRAAWALATVTTHVVGSVALTMAGLATVNWLRR
ncbi:MAG: fluoride efflux transporter CrcB [Pseudomonadota bacterium]|nr:fluoride efflux transporter CrcB [Pseudomonadota bacterium]